MPTWQDLVSQRCPPGRPTNDRLFRLRLDEALESAEIRSGFIATRHRFLGPQRSRIPRLTVIYVLRGSGTYIDEGETEHPLQAGHVVLRWPGRLHRHRFDLATDPALWTCSLPAVAAELLAATASADPERPVLFAGLAPYLLQRIGAFHDALRAMDDRVLGRAVSMLHSLIIDILERAEDQRPAWRHHPWLKQAEDLLTRRNALRLDLRGVAQHCGVSYATLRRVFTAAYGESPGEFRIRRRIERAQALLAETERPIATIAEQLGYADVFAFTKQFAQRCGVPPGAFRKAL